MNSLFTVLTLLGTALAVAQNQVETFCASRTTEAYHSLKCDWGFVVNDPHRIENVEIQHEPSYHTYSRWVLDGRTYVFAYSDIDHQPEDIVADIYLAGDTGYKLAGNGRITGLVTGVSTARLTGGELPDIVFRFEGGQLQYMTVVRLSGETAQEVFRHGSSTMDIVSQPRPMIEAKGKIGNLVEQFAWDPRFKRFRKIGQHQWRKTR
jgi:hypothetical protein